MQFEELKATGNLPSPSGVALEILRLVRDENVKLKDVVHVVSADPVLAGRILRMANSSVQHQEHAVISIKDAIIKLGLGVLSTLVLSLSILDLNKTGACEAFDYNNFWSKSLLRALAMRAVSKYFNTISADEAFTVGLISEIGQLALAQIYPLEFGQCLTNNFNRISANPFCKQCLTRPGCLNDADKELLEEERSLFSIDHHQITLEMLKDWHLPELIIKSVELYQQGRMIQNDALDHVERLASQLHLASFLVGQSNMDHGLSNIECLQTGLDVPDNELSELLGHIFDDWREWKELLSIQQIVQKTKRRSDDVLGEQLPKVLVIEDDRIQLHLLRNYFTQQGFETSVANNGEEALKTYLEFRPRIIVTDNYMEPMGGIEFCKTLRATADGHFVYIILITSDKDPELMKQAFKIGVNDFLAKPINHDELDARILGAIRFISMHKIQDLEHENVRNYAFKLASATRRLESLAFTDQLTGLPNRRFANTRLDLEWSKLIKNAEGFSILSLDLDHFKQINDKYGHDVGDEVLVHFAEVLQNVIRIDDTAARMGGEEFIVITPQADESNVIALGQRIRAEVERNQPGDLGLGRLVTVSVGGAIADLSIDIEGWKTTLKRSDQALYEAKSAGRNCFKIYRNFIQRQHIRIDCSLPVRVRRVGGIGKQESDTTLKNYSKSGMFINHCPEWQPARSEVVEIFFENRWKVAQVLRVDKIGYAVEFLKLD